jgi:hypothetical protein
VLARAVDDEALSDEILHEVRAASKPEWRRRGRSGARAGAVRRASRNWDTIAEYRPSAGLRGAVGHLVAHAPVRQAPPYAPRSVGGDGGRDRAGEGDAGRARQELDSGDRVAWHTAKLTLGPQTRSGPSATSAATMVDPRGPGAAGARLPDG